MTKLQNIYLSFGPDVTDDEIAAALWYYNSDELEQLCERAKVDIAAATAQFLAAKAAADKEFGPEWMVEVTEPARWRDHRDREADLEQLGLQYGEADGIKFWIIPSDKAEVVDALASPPLTVEDEEEAEWLNAHVLHCGHVDVGDDWDTREAWDDPEDRLLARSILLRYREQGPSAKVADWERSRLAYCCRSS